MQAGNLINNGTVELNGTFIPGGSLTLITYPAGGALTNNGTLTIDGGALMVDTLTNTSGATFDFLKGHLTIMGGDLEIGTLGITTSTVNLATNSNITVMNGFTIGTTTITSGHTVVLGGGSFYTRKLVVDAGGALTFNSGQLNVHNDDLAVGAAGVTGLSNTVTVSSGSSITLYGATAGTGDLTIDSGHALHMEGGTVQVKTMTVNGTATFHSGYLKLIQDNLEVGPAGITGSSMVTVGAGSTLAIGDGATIGAVTVKNGYGLTLDHGTITAREIVREGTGTFTYNHGYLDLSYSDLVIGVGGLIGQNPVIHSDDLVMISDYYSFPSPTRGNTTIQSGASLTIEMGGLNTGFTTSGNLTIEHGGLLQGDSSGRSLGGTPGPIGNSVMTNHGTLRPEAILPGMATAGMYYSGDYVQGSDGLLQIDVGRSWGMLVGDSLDVDGSATLGGTLEISFLAGYLPQAGDVFHILTAYGMEGRIGEFDNVLMPEGMLLQYTLTGVDLTAVPEPGTLALLATGACILVALAARRRKKT